MAHSVEEIAAVILEVVQAASAEDRKVKTDDVDDVIMKRFPDEVKIPGNIGDTLRDLREAAIKKLIGSGAIRWDYRRGAHLELIKAAC